MQRANTSFLCCERVKLGTQSKEPRWNTATIRQHRCTCGARTETPWHRLLPVIPFSHSQVQLFFFFFLREKAKEQTERLWLLFSKSSTFFMEFFLIVYNLVAVSAFYLPPAASQGCVRSRSLVLPIRLRAGEALFSSSRRFLC